MNFISNIVRILALGPAYLWAKFKIYKSKKQHYKIDTDLSAKYVKDKSYYQKHLLDNTKLPYFPLCKKITTGGTTGEPFVFFMDTFWTRQKERAYIHDIWSYVGYKPFDLRVMFRGNSSNSKISYNFFENAWNIPANYAIEENKEEIIKFLSSLDKFYLHVYPSSLDTLIQFLGEECFRNLKVAGVLAGSESFPLNKMKAFQQKYGIQIAHWYGHSEYALLARLCKHCEEFHFYPTYGKLSLCGEGIEKEIIATSFNKIGTQFINYRTGDKAIPSQSSCKLDSFPKIKEISGRNQEFFYCRENKQRAFGPFLFGIHGDFWEKVNSIQFLHDEVGKLKVRLRCKESFREDIEKYIEDRFSLVDIEFDYDSAIEKTKLGKHRYFINNLG